MELEELISRITDEVYNRLQTEGNPPPGGQRPSAARYPETAVRAGTVRAGVIGVCMDPKSTIKAIEAACDEAKSKHMELLLVPQWFTEYACSLLKGTEVEAATLIGLPGGETSSFAKYAETKQAVANGAKTVVIPVNMRLCKMGDMDAAKQDFAESLVAAKGKARVFALIEAGETGRVSLQDLARMCSSCGAECVLLSYLTGGRPNANDISAIAPSGTAVGLYGAIPDKSEYASYQAAGCAYFTEGLGA